MKIDANLVGVALCVLLAAPAARADEVSDLKAQLQAMQRQINALQQQLQKVTEKVAQQQTPAGCGSPVLIPAVAKTGATSAAAPVSDADNASEGGDEGHRFFERKP